MATNLDLAHARYPRSSTYDPRWIVDNQMGPNPLWLMEGLVEGMDLRPGERVLDLGCGTALSSVFLAREFGVQVTAADLWIKPAENMARIREAGVEDLVQPLRVDARIDHPYAPEAFDAIVSVDAYQYFGTDDLRLAHLLQYLRAGGPLGIVVPSLPDGFGPEVPANLAALWHPDFWSFHSPEWWRAHWSKSGLVDLLRAEDVPDAASDWLRFERICQVESGDQFRRDMSAGNVALLEADAAGAFGWARVVARKR